jgi:predicted ATPase
LSDVEAVRSPSHRRHSNREDIILSVEGYKAIRERNQLRVAPLTIVSGVNSSGKSSFIQPFLMMKQTLDSAFDPGPLLLHGPNVKITDYSQMLSRGKSRADITTSFTAGMAQGDFSRSVTFSATDQQIGIAQDHIQSPTGRISLSEKLTPTRQRKLREEFSHLAERWVSIFQREEGNTDWTFEVSRNRCFLELNVAMNTRNGLFRIGVTDEFGSDDRWVDFLRGIIHVPGLRGNPERAYPRSAVGSTHPGTFETYVASLVFEWSSKNHNNLAKLSRQLEQLGLTWKLSARKLNDASIELNVGRMPHAQQGGANDLVNVADVGFGVSQTLPVLVALIAAQPGQVVYIEQPEIHLHPRAQLALADALIDAANRGVYVVAETHSSLIIRGIQTSIAEGSFSPRNLSLNWFGRDPQSGFQTITAADVDDAGRFGDWPLDFDEVSREADWTYLEAVDRSSGFGS